jgi:ankyrin repeat protein
LLLEKGADVNASTTLGWPPTTAAAKRGDSVAVDLLISHEARLDFENKDGDTALSIADG